MDVNHAYACHMYSNPTRHLDLFFPPVFNIFKFFHFIKYIQLKHGHNVKYKAENRCIHLDEYMYTKYFMKGSVTL